MILDEADQLLDLGFRQDIEDIESYLPKTKQTFMFSATVSPEIKSIAQEVLKPGYNSVDTVPKNEVPTHFKTQQSFVMASYSQQLQLLYKIITQHQDENPAAKIIVFFSTTKIVSYLASVFSELPGMDVMQIHSLLTQAQRQRTSDRFRRAYSSVLFTSDVSARGVDYPGVTLVIQMGCPSSKEQYIHRIGRTGRAGKTGEGIIILSPYEKRFLVEAGDLPIKEDFRYDPKEIAKDEEMKNQLDVGMNRAPRHLAEECYTSFLGYCKIIFAHSCR